MDILEKYTNNIQLENNKKKIEELRKKLKKIYLSQKWLKITTKINFIYIQPLDIEFGNCPKIIIWYKNYIQLSKSNYIIIADSNGDYTRSIEISMKDVNLTDENEIINKLVSSVKKLLR